MYTLKTWRDPYDEGFNVCSKKEIQFQEGLTVLVGCNGYGKTTTLHNLRERLRKEDIPWFEFDNQTQGRKTTMDSALYNGNFGLLSSLVVSSEGECISVSFGAVLGQLNEFIKTGKNKQNMFANFFGDEEEVTSNQRFILLDAVDSGYSIDNVIDLKRVFDLIIENAKKQGKEIYIIISCNEYELANGENCMDIGNGKYIRFKDYDDYKKFIMKTREKKDKRYAKLDAKRMANEQKGKKKEEPRNWKRPRK